MPFINIAIEANTRVAEKKLEKLIKYQYLKREIRDYRIKKHFSISLGIIETYNY